MNILAWATIILSLLNILLMPLAFGKPRPDFSYATWTVAVIETVIVCLLSLRVLGFI